MSRFSYRIDSDNRLVAMSDNWDGFAHANDGANCSRASLLGRSLLDFVGDSTVQYIYTLLIQRARAGRPARFEYRCDAPGFRREFEMQITAVSPAEVEFISTLQREQARPAIDLFRPPVPGAHRFLRMCSWCHAVTLGTNDWRPLEAAASEPEIMEAGKHTGVTHGICAPCAEAMLRLASS
jgi:hypothetical protein